MPRTTRLKSTRAKKEPPTDCGVVETGETVTVVGAGTTSSTASSPQRLVLTDAANRTTGSEVIDYPLRHGVFLRVL